MWSSSPVPCSVNSSLGNRLKLRRHEYLKLPPFRSAAVGTGAWGTNSKRARASLQTHEPIWNKVAATLREPRRGLALGVVVGVVTPRIEMVANRGVDDGVQLQFPWVAEFWKGLPAKWAPPLTKP